LCGDPKAQQCGRLKDQCAMEAMLHMKKIDIGDLERAVAAKMGS